MNPMTTTASNDTIFAIDLGKYKCVACILDPKSDAFRFTTDGVAHCRPRAPR